MKTLMRSVVPLIVFVLLSPSSRAATATDDHRRGWLGILLDNDDKSQGVLIRGVVEGSPADEARLRAKDAIVAIDGTATSSAPEVFARLREMEPGRFVTLSLNRSGHDLEMSMVLGARPANIDRSKLVRGWLGVEAIELPASLRAHFGAPEDAGVLVSSVAGGSPADDSGIRIGDVIYEADGQPVTSAEAFKELVSEAGVENAIDVVLARDGARIVVGPRVERAPRP